MRYLHGYWLYRGFPPPVDPAFVTASGTTQRISVASAALGGRRQEVLVYLPPGYAAHPHRRYPVFYLLHGVPGLPTAFLLTVRAGVVEDVLRRAAQGAADDPRHADGLDRAVHGQGMGERRAAARGLGDVHVA